MFICENRGLKWNKISKCPPTHHDLEVVIRKEENKKGDFC